MSPGAGEGELCPLSVCLSLRGLESPAPGAGAETTGARAETRSQRECGGVTERSLEEGESHLVTGVRETW